MSNAVVSFGNIFLFELILSMSFSLINGKVIVDKIELEQSDEEFVKVTTNLQKNGEDNLMDIEIDVLKDIKRSIFMKVLIEKSIDGGIKRIYNGDVVDKCHYSDKNEERYPQMRMFIDDFKKYGNFLQPCPLKQGKYYIKGYKFEPKEDFKRFLSNVGEYFVHFIMLRSDPALKQLFSIKWFVKVQ